MGACAARQGAGAAERGRVRRRGCGLPARAAQELRLHIPHTLPHTLIWRPPPRAQGLGVDLANVLYTDVDTIFMGDINACSLPAPRILAAAGEVTKLTPANAGVIYLNLTAWAELHGDLMRFAAGHGWIFPNADQEWLFSFFGDRVAVLPDTYNWKPYWGHPQPGTWGRAPAVKILHIHGPKFQARLALILT